MKRLCGLILVVLLAGLAPMQADGPDDQYIAIYSLIQQGDALNSAGQPIEALAKYTAARSQLETFQRVYSTWNTKVVNFRMSYLEAKIATLKVQSLGNSGPVSAPTTSVGAGAVSPKLPSATEQQLRTVRDQIKDLQAERANLEAKLKEAFATQPAAVDPRELARAREQIQSLMKENDLLKVSLTNPPTGADAVAVAKGMEELKGTVAETSRKLAEQTERANKLAADKAALQGRLDNMASNPPSPVAALAAKELEDLKQTLAAQKERADQLAAEKADLQSRLDNLAAQTNAQSTEAAIAAARELGELKRTLAEQSGRADQLATEKADLQNQLDNLVSQTDARFAAATRMSEDLKKTLAEQTERADKLAAENADMQSRLGGMSAQTNLISELDAAKKALDATGQQLKTQMDLAAQRTQERDALQQRVETLMATAGAAEALRTENEILKKQAADAKSLADKVSEQKQNLADAETRNVALQSQVGILRLEKNALEDRVKQPPPAAPSHPEDLARIKQLEHERDDLQKKLDVAGRKPVPEQRVKSVVVSEKDLTAQVAVLRARVDVLEAKPTPYTAEELALFKNPSARPATVTAKTKLDAKPANQLPAGTVTLAAEAQRYFAARNYDKAEEKYREILQRDENNAYTLANLATIQLQMNHLSDAEKNIQQAVTIAPEDGYNQAVLGFLKFRQAKYDEALDALSRSVSLNPQNAEVQNYLGVTLSHKGLRTQAEAALRKALQIDPNYGDAHNNLAVIYATQTPPLLELARWHYQKALAAGLPQNLELEKLLKAH